MTGCFGADCLARTNVRLANARWLSDGGEDAKQGPSASPLVLLALCVRPCADGTSSSPHDTTVDTTVRCPRPPHPPSPLRGAIQLQHGGGMRSPGPARRRSRYWLYVLDHVEMPLCGASPPVLSRPPQHLPQDRRSNCSTLLPLGFLGAPPLPCTESFPAPLKHARAAVTKAALTAARAVPLPRRRAAVTPL